MAVVRWTKSPAPIGREISGRAQRIRAGVTALAQSHGTRLADRSRDNATWQDRSGDARGGIASEVMASGNIIDIIVYHVMEYGPYLELGTSRMAKYGVMDHEVQVTAAELTADAQALVRRLL